MEAFPKKVLVQAQPLLIHCCDAYKLRAHGMRLCPVLKVTRNSHQFTGLVLMTFPSLFTAHEQEASLALKNTIM